MIFNKNYIVPTEFGEYYYKKPPLYNWFIVFAYKLFGNYSEFATRFFSVFSFVGMGLTLFWIGKKYVNKEFGIFACLLFLVSIDIYYYFSVLAEIDIFYSLITLLSFFSLFHFYQNKQFGLLFSITYFLGALGTLTKGFPSMVFLAISLPVFFIYNRDFKKLFSPYHFLGIFIYLAIVGGYFFVYAQYNELTGYFKDLWSQSSERTLLEKSLMSLLNHLVAFPLETLKNILPASLFLIFTIKKNWFKDIKRNKLIEFCFYIFLSNSLIYWSSPGSRARYVYMLYPLLILILLYFYLMNDSEKRKKAFDVICKVVIACCILLCLALSFIPHFKGLANIPLISIISTLIVSVIFFLSVKNRSFNLLYIILTLVVMRFVFDFTVLPSRAKMEEQAQIEKEDALRIAGIIGNSSVYMYGAPLSHTSVFYLEREIEKVVGLRGRKNLTDYFIVLDSQLLNEKYKVYYKFTSARQERLLIKFLDY
ncbi:MAG TPA: glycosyltransferase family 39 protein [Cytophagales bacterium]|nr:glycosyltransferase family 39 protein [Cytophagales bacterium]